MRKRLITTVATGVLGGALVLTGCSTGGDQDQATPSSTSQHEGHGSGGINDGGGMEHPMDGGPAPEGIEKASSPKYPAGTKVTLTADHMEGMDGANATIVGAFDTYTYAVNFTPTTGGDPIKDPSGSCRRRSRTPATSAWPTVPKSPSRPNTWRA